MRCISDYRIVEVQKKGEITRLLFLRVWTMFPGCLLDHFSCYTNELQTKKVIPLCDSIPLTMMSGESLNLVLSHLYCISSIY